MDEKLTQEKSRNPINRTSIMLNGHFANMVRELSVYLAVSKSEVIRTALRTLHRKEFPPYRPPEVAMKRLSAEEQCAKDGGEVYKDDTTGRRMCRITIGESVVEKPLDTY